MKSSPGGGLRRLRNHKKSLCIHHCGIANSYRYPFTSAVSTAFIHSLDAGDALGGLILGAKLGKLQAGGGVRE